MKDYTIFVICIKNETICETGPINAVCLFEPMKLVNLPIFRILRHYDVITIFY